MSNIRTVIWFSCGAASAVMTKIVLKEEPDAHVVYCDTGSEHYDNRRFLSEKLNVEKSKKSYCTPFFIL